MLLAATALLAAGSLYGCDDAAHQKRLSMREDNLCRTCETIREINTGQCEKMDRTLEILGEQCREDVINTLENPDRVADCIEDDFNRFEERQPVYRREIQDQLDGDCENARKTLPDVIW
jgi:hypothetical protein